MTPEEIYAEMYKDAAWLQERINNRLAPEVIKKLKRVKRFPHLSMNTLYSEKTKIVYNVVFYAYQHRDWDCPRMFIYTKYTHESGKNLVYIEPKGFAIRIYTPHFMQRYKERQRDFVEDYSPIANIDIEFFFILRNWDVEEMKLVKSVLEIAPDDPLAKIIKERQDNSRFWQDPDYERYSTACMTGMCLCERHKKNPNISIYDTYISILMLKYSQLFDFLPAYKRVFLDTLCRTYPRHKDIILKEWNEAISNAPETPEVVEILCKKLAELEARYPVNALI
jgi:hypothetical protein